MKNGKATRALTQQKFILDDKQSGSQKNKIYLSFLRSKSQRMVRGIVLVFLGAFSYGVLTTIVKLAYKDGFTLGQVTGSQVLIGVLTLWLLVFLRRLFQGIKINLSFRKSWPVMLTGISTGLVSVCYYKSVEELPASIAILLLMQFTWISMLIEAIFYRKYPKPKQLIAVFFILVGTYLAGDTYDLNNISYSLEGILFGFLAGFFYAIFIWANGRVGNQLIPAQKSALMVTGSALFILILFPPAYLLDSTLIETDLLWWGTALAIIGAVIPPLFFAYGIPSTGVNLSSIISSVELPVAVLCSSWVLRESVTPLQWTGVTIIMGAIILTNVKKSKKKPLKDKF